MIDNITQALEDFEKLVTNGDITSFWISVYENKLRIKATRSQVERIMPLSQDLFDSLHTFFYGVDRIEYKTHDYANLKSFINARTMLDRLLNKEDH